MTGPPVDRYDPEGPFRAWEKLPQFTLCRYTGELSKQRNTNVRGKGGECPVHGGDACLFQYVQASAWVRELERILAPPKAEA